MAGEIAEAALSGQSDGGIEALKAAMPVAVGPYDPQGKRVGLVIVDEVNGFATPGAGNLAPPAEDAQVEAMKAETDRLARAFAAHGAPILAFLDTHEPGVAEPPYPPHCERGTGEEELVPRLKWLEAARSATLVRKDCINGYVGAQQGGENKVLRWLAANRLEAIVVVGICTDICVMDFVLTLLSARNHGLTGDLADVVVYAPGCSTYHLPKATAVQLGLPEAAAHPQGETHYMGLYFMGARGAIIADRLDGWD